MRLPRSRRGDSGRPDRRLQRRRAVHDRPRARGSVVRDERHDARPAAAATTSRSPRSLRSVAAGRIRSRRCSPTAHGCGTSMLVPDPRERPHSSLGYMMATSPRARRRPRRLVSARRPPRRRNVRRRSAPRAMTAPPCASPGRPLRSSRCSMRRPSAGAPSSRPPARASWRPAVSRAARGIVERAALYDALARRPRRRERGDRRRVRDDRVVEPVLRHAVVARRARARQGPAALAAAIDRRSGGRGRAARDVGARSVTSICANRSSVVAIETEDLGPTRTPGCCFSGRERGAALRGCSLDAEEL